MVWNVAKQIIWKERVRCTKTLVGECVMIIYFTQPTSVQELNSARGGSTNAILTLPLKTVHNLIG